MATIYCTTIEKILGNPENRYFGDGYRFFSLDLKNLEFYSKEIKGQIIVKYNGPDRPRGDAPHIGSMEFMAFSLRISTYAINRICKINIADTNRAYLRGYSIQISKSLDLGVHNFTCKIISSMADDSSLQGYISQIEIHIGNSTKIILDIDHRGYSMYGKLPKHELIPLEFEQMHTVGYKFTELEFGPLNIDLNYKTIETEFNYTHLYEENTFHGIGSSRNNLLPTDATRVFGQLMQVLHYSLINTDRLECQNIWLRKMRLKQERPLFKNQIKASLKFDESREIKLDRNNWNLISLNGKVGNYYGSFQIAHLVI